MSPFLSKLTASWPPSQWCDVTVLVAVSGGADSVALLCGLAAIRAPGAGRLVAAHYNHRLRGSESDGDQAFVASLAGALGVELCTGVATGDLMQARGGQGLEAAARAARYAFLADAAGQYGARYVASAHTADDQAETILHHILRGTGLAGLAGMPRVRPLAGAAVLIRPLLDVTRGEVLDYLRGCDQPWREDSSNAQLDLTRNRIRRELLPLLERDYSPHVRGALLRLGRLAGEADEWLHRQALEQAGAICRNIPGGIEVQTRALGQLPPILARTLLIGRWREQGWPLADMSLEKWEQLLALAAESEPPGSTSAQTFPGGIRAEKSGGVLRLTRCV